MTTRKLRPASDWPVQLDDDEDTLVGWTPLTFNGCRIPPLPADQSIDLLLGSTESTVREKPSASATTSFDSVPRRTA